MSTHRRTIQRLARKSESRGRDSGALSLESVVERVKAIAIDESQLTLSSPVNLLKPAFASLLDALRLAGEGIIPAADLQMYYLALNAELQTTMAWYKSQLTIEPESIDTALAYEACKYSQVMLQKLARFIQAPDGPTLCSCVLAFLEAKRFTMQTQVYLARRETAHLN